MEGCGRPPPPIHMARRHRHLTLGPVLATHGFAVLSVEPELAACVTTLADELESFATATMDEKRDIAERLELSRRQGSSSGSGAGSSSGSEPSSSSSFKPSSSSSSEPSGPTVSASDTQPFGVKFDQGNSFLDVRYDASSAPHPAGTAELLPSIQLAIAELRALALVCLESLLVSDGTRGETKGEAEDGGSGDDAELDAADDEEQEEGDGEKVEGKKGGGRGGGGGAGSCGRQRAVLRRLVEPPATPMLSSAVLRAATYTGATEQPPSEKEEQVSFAEHVDGGIGGRSGPCRAEPIQHPAHITHNPPSTTHYPPPATLITISPLSRVAGLEVRPTGSSHGWFCPEDYYTYASEPAADGAVRAGGAVLFLVLVGEYLELLSAGRFQACLHRGKRNDTTSAVPTSPAVGDNICAAFTLKCFKTS